MHINNTKCDIYIGKSAGKQLMYDIKSAKQSVKIVSPFLSDELVDELVKVHYKGVGVELVTTTKSKEVYNDKKGKLLKLLVQQQEVDQGAAQNVESMKGTVRILFYTLAGFALSLMVAIYLQSLTFTLVTFIPLVIIALAISLIRNKIRSKRIYNYHYTPLFPLKIFLQGERYSFLHSKIYIIDERVAYIGSLNFTLGGTRHNHETSVRVSEKEAISDLVLEFWDLFYDKKQPSLNFQHWGQHQFLEPVN